MKFTNSNQLIFMNKMKKFASAMVMLALVAGAFNMPAVYTANAQSTTDGSGFDFGFDFPDFGLGSDGTASTDNTSIESPSVTLPADTSTVTTTNTDGGFVFPEFSENIAFDQGSTGGFDFPEADTTSGGFDFPDFGFGDGGFDFPDFGFGDGGFDFPDLDLGDGDATATACSITAVDTTIFAGGSVTLNFQTTGFDTVSINGQVMDASSGSYTIANVLTNTTYALAAASADGAAACAAAVTIVCLPPPVDCRVQLTKTADRTTVANNDNVNYTVTIKNLGNSDCTNVKIDDVLDAKLTYLTQSTSNNLTAGYGTFAVYTAGDRTLRFNGGTLTAGEQGTITFTARVMAPTTCGSYTIPNKASAMASQIGTVYSNIVNVTGVVDCPNNPVPSCDSFTATPSNINVGGTSVLAWQTTNVNRVVINNGVGEVAVDGSVTVSPITSTTYLLTAFGANNTSVNCSVPVTVGSDTIPVCEYFTATPNSFGSNGGQTTLSWKVNNATNVSISPTIGTVATQGTQTTNVTGNTTFVLTATDADGDQVTCPAPVTVTPPTSNIFSCANNVSFSASDTSIRRGDDSVLSWSTNNVDTVSINPEIGATTLSGSRSVEPRSDATYTLVATKGTQSVSCPLSVNVTSGGGGGGGGGSKTPRCELTISDNDIRAGEQITLKWDSKNATDLMIKDNHGKTIVDTDEYTSSKKKDYFDGSEKLRPTKDTEYTLTVERNNKERVCKVKVNVDDLKVITDRKPTVAGIALTDVPYTGFEVGPFLTVIFYLLLIAWALFVTYLIVVRRKPVAMNGDGTMLAGWPVSNVMTMREATAVRPDLFPAQITPAPTMVAPVVDTIAPVAVVPANLPVAAMSANSHQVSPAMVAELENRAHSQMALLSSDAIRHFIATTEGTLERNESLDQVIAVAKGKYPLEDGWIVINEARMQTLCENCMNKPTPSENEPFVPAVVPEGSSSLAEAIVTGNVVAAYEMIGHRPMFALADAAADLDALVRSRRGETVAISDMLAHETAKLSDEKIKNMISALTGALDGIYTDEASAVKMAIMKAVKEAA